ncbi:GNAT family N-acetyltransferase [Pseudoroseicyclus tamaricis]|uniref:GNAT family N-acetyltransferase n=1 Tax=Pseudoroseicyclus tamaricis TaxID=2705421 RepID=A0A6B2JY82_9RHOB|nr:GNAT family N-acetyltransferase [Pseudoroseicyclus tamaricis]NDV01569.1 GNAT family N-acetyltransferase [Pseudoroseicyclus tamaricis]
MVIRPLEEADAPAWRQLWQGYLTFYETELPEEIYAATFARLIDPAETAMHGLLALQGDRPVGLAHYIFHRHGWRLDDVCYLQDLFADPAVRGQGVGRALIEAVYAAADAAGAPHVYWITQDSNATARRLYDRIGELTPFIEYQRPA